MPAACRAGIDTHSCGSLDSGGSPNVYVNGYPAHRSGDSQSHGGTQSGCSPNVFVNGRGIARVGDYTAGEPSPPVMHGDNPQASGSPNVFVNG
jgi:uncharacterized Zn-binding protein involved in type VI secretion